MASVRCCMMSQHTRAKGLRRVRKTQWKRLALDTLLLSRIAGDADLIGSILLAMNSADHHQIFVPGGRRMRERATGIVGSSASGCFSQGGGRSSRLIESPMIAAPPAKMPHICMF